jgi:hypothetical protein
MKEAKLISTFCIFNVVNNRFRIGDKVRLMDEAVECEVSRILSDKLVEIRDENGFEYTVNINEIVPLFDGGTFSADEKTNVPEESIVQSKHESFVQFFVNAASLFLCAVPEDFDSLLNTSYKIYLVNSSEEIILYSLFQANAEASSYGVLNAEEEIFAGTFSPVKKSSSLSLKLNFIIHSAENKIAIREFLLSSSDFTDERRFHSHELFIKHILSFDCFEQDEIKIPDEDITKLVDHFSPAEKKVPKEKTRTRKKTSEPSLLTNEKTVDLHIEELTDNYTHMSNAEIISLQLSHFRKELDTALLNHYYRIIFIHGKGNGVLRSRIRSELDAMKLKYKDADMARFGFGATEVLL